MEEKISSPLNDFRFIHGLGTHPPVTEELFIPMPLKIGYHQTEAGLSSKHQFFRCKLAVSFREGKWK